MLLTVKSITTRLAGEMLKSRSSEVQEEGHRMDGGIEHQRKTRQYEFM